MALDYSSKTKIELDNIIANNHPDRSGNKERFLVASEERERRYPGALTFEKSLAAITQAAKEGRCISFKEMSTQNGVTFNKAHWSMAGHLGRLVFYGHVKGLPMLSTVVVNEAEKTTGKLKPENLAGLIKHARDIGYLKADEEIDEEAFVEAQQQAVFKAAADGKMG